MNIFTQKDLEQISGRKIQPDEIMRQIDHFIHGFPFIRLAKPALPGDGIICFTEKEVDEMTTFFEQIRPEYKIVKFVPASGAASRMFKHLFEFREKFTHDEKGTELFEKDRSFNSVYYLLSHLQEIAFYATLKDTMKNDGLDLEQCLFSGDYGTIIDYILTPAGLDYANLPKGLLSFHLYPDGSRTAAGEHLVEAAEYAVDGQRIARIHFTISPEHRLKFQAMFEHYCPIIEQRYGVTFEISYSIQEPGTDTIAVDESNQPCRNPDGTLLFRPGGHGSLLDNLAGIDADVVFVKNIDNVVPDRLKEATFRYKKLLAGYLLTVRDRINKYLERLVARDANETQLHEVIQFVKKELMLDLPPIPENASSEMVQVALFNALNRPIRVCGMVRNEGEPGGGPFWVRSTEGQLSLQIVESSQIDMNNEAQAAIVRSSTHFNPVDLVCSIRDFRGSKFNLHEFVDEETGFISLKSSGGKTLKALERPGLWNGAMAGWITLFVEVPIITFNPVKTVNDLLRNEHLPN